MISRWWLLIIIFSGLATGTNSHAQTWQPIAPMHEPRWQHGGEVLNDGRVLIIGGLGTASGNILETCEIYDPATEQWTYTGNLNIPRYRFQTQKLKDGRVIVAGGLTDLNIATTGSIEIYDPKTGIWTVGPSLSDPREDAEIRHLILPDGRVVFLGGVDANRYRMLNSGDVFDPSNNTVTQLPPMPIALYGCIEYYIPSINSIVVAGGQYGGANGYTLRSTQLYSFANNAWTFADSLHNSASEGVQMPDGKVLMITGTKNNTPPELSNSVELFDPVNKNWKYLGSMGIPRVFTADFPIGDDTVIIIGGSDAHSTSANILKTCVFFDLSTNTATPAPTMNNGHSYFPQLSFQELADSCSVKRVFYACGGMSDGNSITNSCERLTLRSGPSLALPQSLSWSGPLCASFDTTIRIVNTTCGAISSVRVNVTGEDSAYFAIDDTASATIGLGDTLQFTIHGSPTAVRSYNATINISAGGTYSIPLTIDVTGSSAPQKITTLISDVTGLSAGDTLKLPIYLISNQNLALGDARISLTYNANLLEPIDPELSNTLQSGNIFDLQKTASGVSLYFPSAFSLKPNTPLAILRFKTFLTDTLCTTIAITQAEFSPVSSIPALCPLSVTLDSATICLENKCGYSMLQSFERGKEAFFQINPNPADGHLQIVSNTPSQLEDIFDAIGTSHLSQIEIHPVDRGLDLNTQRLPNGIYFLKLAGAHQLVKALIHH